MKFPRKPSALFEFYLSSDSSLISPAYIYFFYKEEFFSVNKSLHVSFFEGGGLDSANYNKSKLFNSFLDSFIS